MTKLKRKKKIKELKKKQMSRRRGESTGNFQPIRKKAKGQEWE